MGHGEETYLFTDNIIFSENLLHDIIYATPIIYELAAPRVIATFPGSNAQINYLGLHKITVTFNQSIQKGVQFYAIRLFSDGDIKSVISSITNNMLVIYSATPLDPPASKLNPSLSLKYLFLFVAINPHPFSKYLKAVFKLS